MVWGAEPPPAKRNPKTAAPVAVPEITKGRDHSPLRREAHRVRRVRGDAQRGEDVPEEGLEASPRELILNNIF